MNPGLYIVGTPIGNLGDVTLRALDVLRAADVILTEDTRHTRVLLQRYGIESPRLSCHKFNEASRIPAVLARIREGAAVALVTDSGMPGVSDPGSRIVTACRREGVAVTVIPGPSAVTAAVSASGFGGNGFLFAGFLDRKGEARRRRIAELGQSALPVVLYESPHRLCRLLDELAEQIGPRAVFVAREMTKRFEELSWGTPAELRDVYASRKVRGEIVVVIAPQD